MVEDDDPIVSEFFGTRELIQADPQHPGLDRIVGGDSMEFGQRGLEEGDDSRTSMKTDGCLGIKPNGVDDRWDRIFMIT
jgi:hypothetical protein